MRSWAVGASSSSRGAGVVGSASAPRGSSVNATVFFFFFFLRDGSKRGSSDAMACDEGCMDARVVCSVVTRCVYM